MNDFQEFYEILKAEGFADWTIEYSGAGSYCWRTRKRIDLIDGDIVDFLHELAHAQIKNPPHGEKHNREWGDNFSKLVRKYLIPTK